MKTKIIGIASTLSVICMLYAFWKVLSLTVEKISELDPAVAASLIAAMSTVTLSVFIASYNSRKAKENSAFEASREKKAAMYAEFIGFLEAIMRNAKHAKNTDDILPKDAESFVYKFTSKIIVYGGPGVIKAYSDWRKNAATKEAVSQIDKLMREMRSDLGESNAGIRDGDLMNLYVANSDIASRDSETQTP